MKTDDLTFKKTEAVEFHPLSYPISCPHCGTLFPPIENNGRLQGSPLQAKEAQANYMHCQPFNREQYLNLDKEELVTLLMKCQALIDEKITDVQTYTSTKIQDLTAEEIVDEWFHEYCEGRVDREEMIKQMEEYASLRVKEERGKK